MHCPKICPLPLAEINDKNDGSKTSTQNADEVDTVVNSRRILLAMPRKEPNKPLFQSTRALRRLSVILHFTLVSVHLILVGIWATNLEQRLIFPFDTAQNKRTSLIITIISTTFGTMLWMRHSIQRTQTLTATHDHAAAWAGIGAAISHIWYQKAVPASIIGVLSVLFYLGTVLILHITTPALFSLATFTLPSSINIQTQGLPDFNRSAIDLDLINGSIASWDSQSWLDQYTAGALYYLPSVVGNATNLGLSDSTLYEVPDVNTGSGNVTVAAIGFNITCGYPTNIVDEFTYNPNLTSDSYDFWVGNWMSAEANQTLQIANTPRNIVTPIYTVSEVLLQSTMFYSTIPIIDSNNVRGPWVNLHPTLSNSVSTIQLFQCLHNPVSQTAVVDAQSRQIQVVEQDIRKSSSAWQPYVGPSHNLTVESIFDMFPFFFRIAPTGPELLSFEDQDHYQGAEYVPTVADLYLLQKLNLFPSWDNESTQATANVTLHDVENALSALFAAMVWTVAHIPPIYGSVFNCSNISCTDDGVNPFILLSGNATAMETVTQARLDVAAGLTASIILLFLSLFFGGPKNDTELPITELGVLHTIWLYRNHPELKTLLSQVEHPTTESLRKAGLVLTRLVESQSE
ncbi:hypothetical protein B0H11DRAFT_2183421 [Mycena galericulata]|nr:hypothetical protein B0H11DRAFT_2183421 [Mycena galericulata]